MIIFAEKIIFITKNWGLKRNKSPKILKKEEDMAKPRKDGMIDNIITEELSEKAVLVGLITQQQNEMKERNASIVERFCALSEQQPLATATKIISYLSKEYDLTPQAIGKIIRDNGISTTSTPLNQIKLIPKNNQL